MMRRKNLEVPIQFFKAVNQNTFDGPEITEVLGHTTGLVSFGSTPYDPSQDASRATSLDSDSERSGRIRVFLKEIPEGVGYGDWILIAGMSNRQFMITSIDDRGVLPGKYPRRLEAVGEL